MKKERKKGCHCGGFCDSPVTERVKQYPGRYMALKYLAEHAFENPASGSAAYFENPKSKCYLKCFFEHNKLFHANGDFDIAAALVLVDESIREQARPLGEKCAGEHNKIADRCEKAYEVMKCFFKASPELFPHLGIFEPPHA
ncbi:general odorant-binding protein 83a-like [Neodiprion virginianus]|uniref:general odorant-binding protein 83a-like n=1 Tax=Neodiprion virginianus TaxID=2961670 RepID=UPI001EE6E1FF|nr:general odorant-binding protein 83a-like [Neodiprion virginianus]